MKLGLQFKRGNLATCGMSQEPRRATEAGAYVQHMTAWQEAQLRCGTLDSGGSVVMPLIKWEQLRGLDDVIWPNSECG